jgi:hypothetical protein
MPALPPPGLAIEANSDHKNVYSALALAMPLRLVANNVADRARASASFLMSWVPRFETCTAHNEIRHLRGSAISPRSSGTG